MIESSSKPNNIFWFTNSICSILKKFCLERAREFQRRISFEFEKWAKFGYTNSNPDLEPILNDEIERRLCRACPKVFRCTECGKYRAIEDYDTLTKIDPAFFTCSDSNDKVNLRLTAKITQCIEI